MSENQNCTLNGQLSKNIKAMSKTKVLKIIETSLLTTFWTMIANAYTEETVLLEVYEEVVQLYQTKNKFEEVTS